MVASVMQGFLLVWVCIRKIWSSLYSNDFGVSNTVHQLNVVFIFPFVFAVYLDDLLSELSNNGVGCLGFVGTVCYVNDVGLLAPRLRMMLDICCS